MKISQLKNFPSRILTYLKEVKSEMSKVTWPTRKETIRYTLIVIGISFVVALFLGGLDYFFTFLIRTLV
jgi:preprotein translocase subunit SecE